MLKLLPFPVKAGLLVFLLLAFHAVTATAAVPSIQFRQVGSGEVVVELSGFALPCQTPTYLPNAVIRPGLIQSSSIVSITYGPSPPPCVPGAIATNWSQMFNLGILVDADYYVQSGYPVGFMQVPPYPLGNFSIRQGQLVVYENLPVPASNNVVLTILATLLAAGGLIVQRRRRIGQMS